MYKNGHSREQEAETLQEKLNAIKQSIRAGIDVQRNRQREKYLIRRLRRLEVRKQNFMFYD